MLYLVYIEYVLDDSNIRYIHSFQQHKTYSLYIYNTFALLSVYIIFVLSYV